MEKGILEHDNFGVRSGEGETERSKVTDVNMEHGVRTGNKG